VITSMYGSGKSLVANWVVKEMEGKGERVVRVSLKDLPIPSEGDIPNVCGYKSWSAALRHSSRGSPSCAS